jgi:hypothetical protein
VFALELKAARGRLGPGQQEWLQALEGGVVDARVVRPDDLDVVLALLAQRERPPAA